MGRKKESDSNPHEEFMKQRKMKWKDRSIRRKHIVNTVTEMYELGTGHILEAVLTCW